MTTKVPAWLDFAVQQLAAESYLDGIDLTDSVLLRRRLVEGVNHYALPPDPNRAEHPTRMLPSQADSFLARFNIIDHYPNDATGFSATLLYDNRDGSYTLSFRSTEFRNPSEGGDFDRDALAGYFDGKALLLGGAGADVFYNGFAFSQLASMENYYQRLKRADGGRPALLPADSTLNVTGYSLGGHLATVFTEMHASRIKHTYLFNSPGRGDYDVTVGSLSGMLSFYQSVLADPYHGLDRVVAESDDEYALLARAVKANTDGVTLPTVDGNVYLDPRYHWAVHETSRRFSTSKGIDYLIEDSLASDADAIISNIFGLAAQDDSLVVATAGIDASNRKQIFIEDQPDAYGDAGLASMLGFRESPDAPGSFGNTHSIILLIDSLTLTEALQSIDANLDRAMIEDIYAAASAARASGGFGEKGLAEGGSLELTLDAVRKVVLGEAFVETGFENRAGGFGDVDQRSRFHQNIADLVTAAAGYPELRITSLAGMSAVAIQDAATPTNLAYRHALLDLAPLVVEGHAELFDAYDKQGELSTMNEKFIVDRSRFLQLFLSQNGEPAASHTSYTFSWNSAFDDRATGRVFDGGASLVIFGADDNAGIEVLAGSFANDRLYGRRGDDWLAGDFGSDYLEGGAGNDTLFGLAFGGIDDYEASVGGKDTLIGGAGFDTYYAGFGDTVVDDGAGEGLVYLRAQQLLPGYRIATDPANKYRSYDGQHEYVLDGTTLTVRVQGDVAPDHSLTIENFAPGRLGIELETLDVADIPDPDQIRVSATTGDDIWALDAAGTGLQIYNAAGAVIGGELFVAPVHEIRGLGGSDTLKVDADIPGLVVWGDSNGAGLGVDGDDFIEVDRLRTGSATPATVRLRGVVLNGEGGDDFLSASQRNDLLVGGLGHDFLQGNGGDDIVIDVEGNNWLEGGEGADFLVGGAGNDRLHGGAGADTLDGGGGDDRLYGDAGGGHFFRDGAVRFWDGASETISVFPGFSRVIADALPAPPGSGRDDDMLRGGAGSDRLFGGGGNDALDGGADDDLLEGEAGDDTLRGGSGADALYGDKNPNTYDADMLVVSGVRFRIHRDARDVAGNDTLDGGTENDSLLGGGGNDTYVFGPGYGTDVILDTAGALDRVRLVGGIAQADVRLDVSDETLTIALLVDDVATGDSLIVPGWFGADSIEQIQFDDGTLLDRAAVAALVGERVSPGYEDADGIFFTLTSNSEDTVAGGSGVDVVYAAAGDDQVNAGAGNDRVFGGAGDDTLRGDGGDDRLFGEAGADTLDGGAGTDLLEGGSGDDRLTGGAGNDILAGGSGDDRYRFEPGWGGDVLSDAGGVDRIEFGAGIAPEEVQVTRAGVDLMLSDVSGANRVSIRDWFARDSARIESVRFADSTVWDASELEMRTLEITGSAGNETLTGYQSTDDVLRGLAGNDRLYGLGGDDTLQGGDGDDLLAGGAGDDRLIGGAGNDTYVVAADASMDLVVDDGADATVNVLRLAEGIVPGDVTPARVGEDLVLNVGADGQGARVVGYYRDPAAFELRLASGTPVDVDGLFAPPVGDGAFVNRSRVGFRESRFASLQADAARADTSLDPVSNRIVILVSDPQGPAFAPVRVGNEYFYPDLVGSLSGTSWHWESRSPPDRRVVDTAVLTWSGSSGNDVVRNVEGVASRFGYREANLILGRGGSHAVGAATSGYVRSIAGFEYADEPRGRYPLVGSGLPASVPTEFLTYRMYEVSLGGGDDTFDGTTVSGLIGAVSIVDGGTGNDTLTGGWNDDWLFGGPGDDVLIGDAAYYGNDVLAGGDGSDVLRGGGGADAYYVGYDETGVDLVEDNGDFAIDRVIANMYETDATPWSDRVGLSRGIPGDRVARYLKAAPESDIPQLMEWLGYPTDLSRAGAPFVVDTLHMNVDLSAVTLDRATVEGHDAIDIRWGRDSNRGVQVKLRRVGEDALGYGIERFVFNDATLWRDELTALLPAIPLLLIEGTEGDDRLIGTKQDELIRGLAGDDFISDGPGSDVIIGGTGTDIFEAGEGGDIYQFSPGDGTDYLIVFVNDVFRDPAPEEVLRFGDGTNTVAVQLSDLKVTAGADGMLTIQYGVGDSVSLPYWYDTLGLYYPIRGVNPLRVESLVAGPDGQAVQVFSLTAAELEAMAVAGGGANTAPVVTTPIADQAALQDALFTLSLTDVFADPDPSDSVTLSAALAGGAALPSWLSFDAASGSLSGRPSNADVGVISIDVTATDVGGLSASDSFTLAIEDVNDAPTVAVPLADVTASEDAPFSLVVPPGTFADIDVGTTLTLSAQAPGGAVLPGWLVFDAAAGAFRGTPANDDVGLISVVVTAADHDGLSVSDTFALAVLNTNDAPVVTAALSAGNTTEGDFFTYALPLQTFLDVDRGDTLSLSATLQDGSALPGWLSLEASTAVLSGVPPDDAAGVLSLLMRATDSSGASAQTPLLLGVRNRLVGSVGDDVIFASAGDDRVTGGDGNDDLRGYYGNDELDGDDGDDLLRGDDGADVLRGGAGNDTLHGGGGADVLYGGAGDDTLDGYWGADMLYGGGGNDTFVASNSSWEHDTYSGGAGYDRLVNTHRLTSLVLKDFNGDNTVEEIDGGGVTPNLYTARGEHADVVDFSGTTLLGVGWLDTGSGDDVITGSAGDDVIFASYGNDRVSGGDGNDDLRGYYGNDALDGGAGDDLLRGDDGADVLRGGAGNDTLHGGGGADVLYGGAGDDTLDGYWGADMLYGGGGDDTFVASNSSWEHDTYSGGAGYDRLVNMHGYTSIYLKDFNGQNTVEEIDGGGVTPNIYTAGGDHADVVDFSGTTLLGVGWLDTGSGDDVITGSAGDDVIFASYGNDRVSGGDGNDDLRGYYGNDALDGGAGDDLLRGDDGADVLRGGAGNDTLHGGLGDDRYRFERGDGVDVIADGGGSGDTLEWGDDVLREQLWFTREQDDLAIDLVGTTDRVRIDGWYASHHQQVDSFTTAAGDVLYAAQVQMLVQAMAAFAPPSSSESTLPADVHVAVAPVIAAAWQAA